MVGPYGKYGEHAFKACAENGTHYVDVTGELPFVARMIKKYEDAAKRSGALMFPQLGLESVPPDLMTWVLAALHRDEFQAKTRDVTVSIHRLRYVVLAGWRTSRADWRQKFCSLGRNACFGLHDLRKLHDW